MFPVPAPFPSTSFLPFTFLPHPSLFLCPFPSGFVPSCGPHQGQQNTSKEQGGRTREQRGNPENWARAFFGFSSPFPLFLGLPLRAPLSPRSGQHSASNGKGPKPDGAEADETKLTRPHQRRRTARRTPRPEHKQPADRQDQEQNNQAKGKDEGDKDADEKTTTRQKPAEANEGEGNQTHPARKAGTP